MATGMTAGAECASQIELALAYILFLRRFFEGSGIGCGTWLVKTIKDK